MDFSIIIPAYNEENNIVATVAETTRVLEDFNSEYEIIVVDDGSTDETLKNLDLFLRELKKIGHGHENEENIIIKSYSPNKGKGYALKHGAGFSRGKYVMFLDADLDLHPSHIQVLFEIMQKNDADAVIGSKLHKNSILDYPKTRKVFSFSYYRIVRFLFRLPIKDTQTGIKLFKSEALKECLVKVLNRRYTFDLELLLFLIKKGYKVCESPIHLKTARVFGRIGLSDAFTMFADTLRVFWRYYILNYYK